MVRIEGIFFIPFMTIKSEESLQQSLLNQKKYLDDAIVYTLISDFQNSLTTQLAVQKLLNNLSLVPDFQ
jgi:hypothetical protein